MEKNSHDFLEGQTEKTKVCQKCGAENRSSSNFCGACGNKFQNDNDFKKEAQNKTEQEDQIDIMDGDVVSMEKLLSVAGNIRVHIGGDKVKIRMNRNGSTMNIEVGYMIGSKFSGKYISFVNGDLFVGDFEQAKIILDEEIIKDPSILEDFEKAIAVEKLKGGGLSEVSQYVEDKYFGKKQEFENQEDDLEKKDNLGEERKEAKDDLMQTLLSWESAVGKFQPEIRKAIIDTTYKEIDEASDDDFINIALAAGLKEVVRIAKTIKEKNKVQ